jgi:tetratricopeptide (TPR) repeat protein
MRTGRIIAKAICRRALLLVLLALCSPATAQRSGVLSPAYEAVVLRYQSGDRQGAISEAVGWPASRLREEMRALGALREHRVPVRAALMLHSDCAQRARLERRSPGLHESVAAEIASMLRDDGANRAFARRWYEVMAGLAAGENRWLDALGWAERGVRDFPDSAELLVALGAIEEVHALQASQSTPPPAQERLADPSLRRSRSALLQRREVQGHLEKARQALRAAIVADPSLAEAYLRLGRLAWRLGEEGDARSALEQVLTRDHTRGEVFLAHLFLGRVHEDAGRLEEAARSYEAALGLEVNSQSARLALSHVHLRRGDASRARAETERALRPAGARLRPDPFWLYPWGASVGVEERLEALRREAGS